MEDTEREHPMANNPTLYGADGVTPVNRKTTNATARSCEVWTAFDQRTGLSVVRLKMPGLEEVFEYFPNEAVTMGAKLMQAAETALGNAMALRVLLELGGMDIQEATQTLQAVSASVREGHAIAYERLLEHLAEAEKRLAEQEERTLNNPTGAALEHCPVHPVYDDSCHDCYDLQYGKGSTSKPN